MAVQILTQHYLNLRYLKDVNKLLKANIGELTELQGKGQRDLYLQHKERCRGS